MSLCLDADRFDVFLGAIDERLAVLVLRGMLTVQRVFESYGLHMH